MSRSIDMLEMAIAESDTLLEGLRATYNSLADQPYEFGDWTQCTCGHIYRGVTGQDEIFLTDVTESVDDRFKEALVVVCVANGIAHHPYDSLDDLRNCVSSATAQRTPESTHMDSEEWNEAARQVAFQFIENAIRYEEARNEEARLAILRRVPA